MSALEDMKAVLELGVIIGGMKADVERLKSDLAEARTERDEWKKKYEAAAVHGGRLRSYNESLVPLIEAAQELENSYHDVYAVNRVREASKSIRETWEDTRARCS